jgi:hypothetical protein
MRIGSNPLKKKPQLEPYKRHRIIMPIFIGGNHEYFAQCLETLKLCLRSLYATIDRNLVSVTVINNDSVPEVDEVLRPYVESKQIDRYIRNQTNRGKPDAVAGEIMATYEPFVTLTDCDVLFYQGWLRAIEDVFSTFRGVGAVSPFPVPHLAFYENATTWLSALGSLRARSGKFVSDDALHTFSRSIGFDNGFFKPEALHTQFQYRRRDRAALIGTGHFVVTFRRAVFDHMTYQPKLAGASNGERDIDAASDHAGYLRLSTPEYHVYHLGNVYEEWMPDQVSRVESEQPVPLRSDEEFVSAARPARVLAGYIPDWLRRAVFPAIRLGGLAYLRWRHSGVRGLVR